MKIGNREIEDFRLGSLQCEKVYVGSSVVWEKGGLPSGYTEVKYLESSGTQYIDTNYRVQDTSYFTYETEVKSLYTNFMSGICGERDTQDTRICWAIHASGTTVQVGYYNQWFNVSITNITNWHTLKSEVLNDKYRIYVNNNYVEANIKTFSCDYPIYLFGINNMGSYFDTFKAYICMKEFKMFEDGTLVRHYVPCLDRNGIPCMYDKVTKTTFYNSGTGTFGYETMDGVVVNPQ